MAAVKGMQAFGLAPTKLKEIAEGKLAPPKVRKRKKWRVRIPEEFHADVTQKPAEKSSDATLPEWVPVSLREREWLDFCAGRFNELSEWERSFVESIQKQIVSGRMRLSKKQWLKLRDVWQRVKGRE